MLTWEDDVEVHAPRKRGWSISAIARHTCFDLKTVRKYLNGGGKPGVRARPSPDPFDPFVDYVSARLVEDPHLWARTLFDELEGLSYPSLTRNIRARNLRPVCEVCRTATDRPNAVTAHPPGDETQWDWLELVRVAERRTGQTWRRIATELGRVHAVALTGSAGTAVHTTPLNTAQAGIYRECRITPPAEITAINPA